jgi:hypothetical protein
VARDSCSSTRLGTHRYSGDDSQSGCGTQANTYSDRTRSQGASSDPGEGSLERRLNGRQLYVWHAVDIRRGPWTSRRDRKNGVGGYWATQILPFADAASFTGYMDFETAIYQTIASTKAA